jgi:phosphatidyl-myo-inositol dimannoside synthase
VRIILVTEGLDGQPGGIQRVSRAVVDAIKSSSETAWIWSANDVCRVEKTEGISIKAFGKQYWRMLLFALTVKLPKVETVRVFAFHLSLAPIAWVLSRRLDCSFEIFLHGVEAWKPRFPLYVELPLRKCAGFGSNSEFTWSKFIEIHPEYAHQNNGVVSLGLNQEFLDAMPSYPSKARYDGCLLSVMRFEEDYKGITTLLEAVKLVQQKHPMIRLKCVGDGPLRAATERHAREIALTEMVHFEGRVSDEELARLYQECGVFVMLSEGEGFGIVYLEAMFFGKPCIATLADASKEIVLENQTGFCVPPRDVNATADAILKLIEDDQLRTRLGAAGRELVQRRHTPEKFRERLMEFMRL